MFSNIRLLDCINRPEDLINTAIELGLSGIAITDHECVSGHISIQKYVNEVVSKEHPDFVIALGNEIYLVDKRENGIKYYHFILVAKDAIGHKALRVLSSGAWYNLYVDRGMERVPTTKDELRSVMKWAKGHVVATSACMGGELSTAAYNMALAENAGDIASAEVFYKQICDFMSFCLEMFGDDFYVECAPSTAKDQCLTNQKLYRIAHAYNVPIIVGTDAHYLTKKDRYVHKSYLNSKGGEREVDSFYEFTYLMEYDEVHSLLSSCFNSDDIADEVLRNSEEVRTKFTNYSLERKQIIPKINLSVSSTKSYDASSLSPEKYPILCDLLVSDNIQERYWVHECFEALTGKNVWDEEYLGRLEIEADIIKHIGNQLDDCLFAYFNTFKHYIDLFWECGSIVGPGRGSATGFLSNYLLGITQLDPIRWHLAYWRFLNKERVELPDIDIDLAPSRRPAIFEAIRRERGELGLVQVATFGTEGTKSAILTACRGYRSDDYPEGIDVDQAQYMSSLIPQERGFLWPIADVIYGNEEKDRRPVKDFIREVANYPGLLEIITSIEGLVNKRSSHASGVILYGDDPYDTASFMRTPSGDLITCYDLHSAEAAGDTKYDFLVTEVSDKMIKCLELLQKDERIEKLSLRDTYNKYLHPEVMDTTDQRIWDHLAAGDVLDVFQFNSSVGLAMAKKLRPQNPMEMTAANAMIRLMSEKDKESQQDRYSRIQKQGLQVFEDEMLAARMTDEQRALMHKHCDQYWGCCAIQEQMMECLMDIAGFTLGEANAARKIVAKKQMAKIPSLREQVYDRFDDSRSADYFWETCVAPQLGYAFSLNHSLPYSFVGMQTIYLAANFNPIYWNTACLIVNSGATDEEAGGSTDYGKIAKAIGDITNAGIKVSLANVNKSNYGFIPDVDNNQILFGLKGMLNVGDDLVASIIEHRPYASPRDFLNKVNPGKQAMISLIKGGAFDEMEDRKFVMAWYIWETCDKKSRLTLQNMPTLIKRGLLEEKTSEQITARRVYEFNRYLKAITKASSCIRKDMYNLDERAMSFLLELGLEELIKNNYINVKSWDKVYQKYMDVFRSWLTENKDEILQRLNTDIFLEDWNKYAKGTISAWEMEALCFYYHEHELAHIDNTKYGFADFYKLPKDPVVDTIYRRGEHEIKIYKLERICGTCIAKNKAKSTVTILTTSGVVEVRYRKEYFSLFDKQISERGVDGVKHIVEKSWFNRGSMIVVMGIRSGDSFISKKYSSVATHQLYKILEVLPNGELVLQDARYKGELEDGD